MCSHIERGIDLVKLSSQLFKSKLGLSQCEDCVAGVSKDNKGRSSRKKAARLTDLVLSHQDDNKWVCLACGHVACGTLSDNLTVDGKAPNFTGDENKAPTSGHAWKHSFYTKHPLALQAGENLVSWCFRCNMPVEYPMPLNTQDDSPLVGWRNPLQDAAEVVQEKLSKKRGFLKDSAKMCYTMEPVRCVIDTVRCVIDSATHAKASDAVNVANPSVSVPCIGSGKKQSVKGLVNLGNTCFFNAVMQNLLALDMLQDYFNQEPRDSEGPLTTSLRHLYQEVNSEHVPVTNLNSYNHEYGLKRSWRGAAMWGSSEKVCNPCFLFDAICAKAPRFRGFQQQDSHELLRYLLEGLNSEEKAAKASPNGDLKKVVSLPLSKVLGQNGHDTDLESAEEGREHGKIHPPQVIPTLVESVFGGQLSSTVHCCDCGNISVVHETMLDLSLQVPTRQILKKKQAHENHGILSLSGGGSEKGSLYEDSRFSEPAPMTSTQETTASVSKESNESLLDPFLSSQADRINISGPEVAGSSNVTFNDKFCKPNFACFSDGSGMILEKGFLQKSFDISHHADHRLTTLFAGVEDCIPGNALNAELDLSTCEESINLHEVKEIDMQWHRDTASANHASSESLQNELIFVKDSSTTAACDMPHDKDGLALSKDECLTSGITLPLYRYSDVANIFREEEITCLAPESNPKESSCAQDELPNVPLETKKSFEASRLVLKGAEALSNINQETGAFQDHVEGIQDTEWTWEADGTAFGDAKVTRGLGQAIDHKDDVLPLSLEACLADFTNLELLCGDNAWECENCSRLAERKENNLALDDRVKIREDHPSTEIVSENALEQKDENNILFSNGSTCNSNQSKVEENGIYQAFQNANLATKALSGIGEGDGPSLTDHNVEQMHGGCANSSAAGGGQHMRVDSFKVESDDKEGSITCTLNDMSNGDQKNKVGIKHLNNHDKVGCAQSSSSGKSVTPLPLFRKHLSNLRKEKLSFFTAFFPKAENHKVKIEQPQNFAKRDATKKLMISKSPIILTVHLKRFAQDARGRFNKLCGHVAFSEFLDLLPYLDPRSRSLEVHDKCIYRLLGIVEHRGTMRGGHYVAYVRGPCVEESIGLTEHDKDSWYSISDSRVCKTTLQDVLSREAYLLFYERCNAKEEELKRGGSEANDGAAFQ